MRLFTIALMVSAAALGQRPPRQVDTLVSPEVHADRRVTFRLRAPEAHNVTVRGEWMKAPEKLAKDESGVWSITLGPVEPDVYSYSFTVDGVQTVDPRNPQVKLGVRSSNTSVLEVKGEKPLAWDVQNVPHGAVEFRWYASKAVGTTRRFAVYTPPGYDPRGSARYPVLYLLHGSGDDEGSWVWYGRANLIFDNLLAEKKMRPMIVVMPFGHATPPNDYSPASRGRNTSLFEEDLIGDVLPAVEAAYRVEKGPKNRAIAGLSMGGAQSLHVGLKHLDTFGAIGAFSSGGNLDQIHPLLANAKGKLSVFWIGCGEEDNLLPASEKLVGELEQLGVKHIWRKTAGAHTWRVWRRYLAEVAPLLFRGT
jgi:enterochelin esterase family protein